MSETGRCLKRLSQSAARGGLLSRRAGHQFCSGMAWEAPRPRCYNARKLGSFLVFESVRPRSDPMLAGVPPVEGHEVK
jgi:hypothetical protein